MTTLPDGDEGLGLEAIEAREPLVSHDGLPKDRYAAMAQFCAAKLSEHDGKVTVCLRDEGHEPVPMDTHSLLAWYRKRATAPSFANPVPLTAELLAAHGGTLPDGSWVSDGTNVRRVQSKWALPEHGWGSTLTALVHVGGYSVVHLGAES